MKRNRLLNRVISLGLVGILYLTLSASAYADTEGAADETVSVSENQNEDTGTVNEEVSTTETEVVESTDGESEVNETSEGETTEGETTEGETTEGETTEGETTEGETTEGETTEGETTEGETTEGETEEGETTEGETTEGETTEGETTEGETTEGETEEGETTEGETTEGETAEEETTEDATSELSEEDLQWDLDGDGVLSEEELEAKALSENTLEEEECIHEYIYSSNGDGTHTVTCSLCDMESFIESCEYDENGVCTKCGYHRLPDPVLVYEDEEIIITVAGAIPENADLSVTPIKKDNEETAVAYDAVENALINETDINEADDYGFLAYDISFIDIETGEEVEPNGDVTVSMEAKEAIKPDDVETDEDLVEVEVTVQHINEQTATIDNLTDQGAATVTLDENKAITGAEFTSNSFSTYVFTWMSSNTYRYVNVEFENYDTDGNELQEASTTEYKYVDNDSSIDVRSYVEEIEDYEYLKATYNNKAFDRFEFRKTGNGQNRKYYLDLINGTETIASIQMYKYDYADTISVSLIYEKEITTSLSVTKNATGAPSKDENVSYEFTLIKDGVAVAAATYEIDGTAGTTTDEGKFNLKTGETAEFTSLTDGTYTITETAINSETYGFEDFITKIYIDGASDASATYEAQSEDARAIDAEVEEGTAKAVRFKNMYTTYNTTSTVEQLAKFIRYYPDNDDYRLTVKFTGPETVKTTTIYDKEIEEGDPIPVDIVLVIDKSSSMSGTRISDVEDAIDRMAEIFSNKDKVDSKFKMVYFSKTASLATSDWIDADDLGDAFNTSTSTGTNYEQGLLLGLEQFDTGRTDAKQIIIFLTDGQPTVYGNPASSIQFSQAVYDSCISAASQVSCDGFYAIGVDFGSSVYPITENGVYKNITAEEILDRMIAASGATNKSVSTVDSSAVADLFESLSSQIQSVITEDSYDTVEKYWASDVTLIDPLSEYVEIEPNSEFYINVSHSGEDLWDSSTPVLGKINENGEQEKAATFTFDYNGEEITLTATYVASTKTMKLEFPTGYSLDPDYAISVSFMVIPSAKAYSEYLASGYPHKGGENTDNSTAASPTSEGKPGFYSNNVGDEKARAEYTYLTNEETRIYNIPVVQVKVGEWELFKTDATAAKYLSGAVFRLVEQDVESDPLTYQGQSTDTGEVIWYALDENGAYTVETLVAPGRTYKMTEITAPNGYRLSSEYWIISLAVNNTPTITKYTADGGEEVYEAEAEVNDNVSTYTFSFINETSYGLPEAGGQGVYKTTVGGIMLMIIAAWLFLEDRRNKAIVNS